MIVFACVRAAIITDLLAFILMVLSGGWLGVFQYVMGTAVSYVAVILAIPALVFAVAFAGSEKLRLSVQALVLFVYAIVCAVGMPVFANG